jgi:hypothetical protein
MLSSPEHNRKYAKVDMNAQGNNRGEGLGNTQKL